MWTLSLRSKPADLRDVTDSGQEAAAPSFVLGIESNEPRLEDGVGALLTPLFE